MESLGSARDEALLQKALEFALSEEVCNCSLLSPPYTLPSKKKYNLHINKIGAFARRGVCYRQSVVQFQRQGAGMEVCAETLRYPLRDVHRRIPVDSFGQGSYFVLQYL